MGREFDYDVRVMVYDCTKTPNIVISFYNDIHHVLDCNRVNIVVDKDHVIFKPGDNSKNSIKFSGQPSSHVCKLMTCKEYEKLSKFIGVYDLQYDVKSGFYYISTETWREAQNYDNYGYRKGLSQLQHNVGDNKGPKDVSFTHKPHIIKEDNMDSQTIRKTSAEKNAESVVRSALLQLMETQLKEEKCAEALATLTTLKNYI